MGKLRYRRVRGVFQNHCLVKLENTGDKCALNINLKTLDRASFSIFCMLK